MKHIRNVIGPQVRRIRYERGFTQEALAAELQREGWDLSRSSLANLEAQDRWVVESELFLLARVLKVSMNDLFPPVEKVKKFVSAPYFKRN